MNDNFVASECMVLDNNVTTSYCHFEMECSESQQKWNEFGSPTQTRPNMCGVELPNATWLCKSGDISYEKFVSLTKEKNPEVHPVNKSGNVVCQCEHQGWIREKPQFISGDKSCYKCCHSVFY